MNIMRDSVMEINAGMNDTSRVKVVVREVWVEVDQGKVIPWVSTFVFWYYSMSMIKVSPSFNSVSSSFNQTMINF